MSHTWHRVCECSVLPRACSQLPAGEESPFHKHLLCFTCTRPRYRTQVPILSCTLPLIVQRKRPQTKWFMDTLTTNLSIARVLLSTCWHQETNKSSLALSPRKCSLAVHPFHSGCLKERAPPHRACLTAWSHRIQPTQRSRRQNVCRHNLQEPATLQSVACMANKQTKRRGAITAPRPDLVSQVCCFARPPHCLHSTVFTRRLEPCHRKSRGERGQQTKGEDWRMQSAKSSG